MTTFFFLQSLEFTLKDGLHVSGQKGLCREQIILTYITYAQPYTYRPSEQVM
jgi:hypothetical protein